MENIEISPETKKFVEESTDRDLQNQIYITLRKIEILQNKSFGKLSILAGIAIFYLICSIIGAFYIANGLK